MDKKEMLTPNKATELRALRAARYSRIYGTITNDPIRYPELSVLLNDSKWQSKIHKWINSIEPGKPEPPSQMHHLIHYLDPTTEEQWRIDILVFEQRLQRIRVAVREQGKTKSFKKPLNQLIANNANQVHSSIFEFSILDALLLAFPVELYPVVGKKGKDVDASTCVCSREIYIECTIRGYSDKVDHREGVVDKYLAPKKMIEATLGGKVGDDGQLTSVAYDYPTILFTCIGRDAYDRYYTSEITDALRSTPCSAIFVFDRYLCRQFDVFVNPKSPHSLTDRELQLLISSMTEYLPSKHMMTHHVS